MGRWVSLATIVRRRRRRLISSISPLFFFNFNSRSLDTAHCKKLNNFISQRASFHVVIHEHKTQTVHHRITITTMQWLTVATKWHSSVKRYMHSTHMYIIRRARSWCTVWHTGNCIGSAPKCMLISYSCFVFSNNLRFSTLIKQIMRLEVYFCMSFATINCVVVVVAGLVRTRYIRGSRSSRQQTFIRLSLVVLGVIWCIAIMPSALASPPPLSLSL